MMYYTKFKMRFNRSAVPIQCWARSRSSPEITNVLLEVVSSTVFTERASALGANLKMKMRTELVGENQSIKYLDGLIDLAGSTEIMSCQTAEDGSILPEFFKANLTRHADYLVKWSVVFTGHSGIFSCKLLLSSAFSSSSCNAPKNCLVFNNFPFK